MATINKALKTAQEGGDYCIKGVIVAKQIFFKRREGQISKLLIEIIVDQNGDVFEVKSWSETKAYTVFRRFQPNDHVQIEAWAQIREPNRKYSLAKGEIYGRWFMIPIDGFKLNNGIHCFSRIENYHKAQRKPANVVGLFREIVEGPRRCSARGHTMVQGHYLRLVDESCQYFQVLIWTNPNLEKASKSTVESFKADDLILVIFAREQEERYRVKTSGFYTLTTTYPAIANPTCVSEQVYSNFRRGQQSLKSECYSRFEPGN